MATKKQMLDSINAYPDDYQFVQVYWGQEDIQGTAENEGKVLTDEEIGQVCDYLESNHDAEYGMNWESISFAIGEITS